MSLPWRQYGLKTDDGRYTTGWLRIPLKRGQRITLAHAPDLVWTVIHVSTIRLEEDPQREWKVGGLSSRYAP